MEFWLYAVLMLTLSTIAVMGNSSGAPDQACGNGLVPGHTSPSNMATGDVPFNVNTSNIGDSYTPDTTYTIVLSGGTDNTDFRGFIIQGRVRADESPVGVFVSGTNYQLQCDGNTAATHTNGIEKTMVTLSWTSPPSGTGDIFFRYAFVDRYSPGTASVFWAQQETASITEALPPTVMFNESMYSVDENGGPVRVVVVISEPPVNDIIIEVYNMDGTATGGDVTEQGVDYASGPYSVTISGGETYGALNIPIVDDGDFEEDETFMLTINSSSLPAGFISVGDPYQATVTILDDDTTFVMFNQSTYSVNEDDGPVQPVLDISKSSPNDITVQVYNTDMSATRGVDYTSGPYSVLIPANVTRVSFDISITNDDDLEDNEYFMLTINSSSLPTGFLISDPYQATVTIVDDDTTFVMFSQATYSVNEDDGSVLPVLNISKSSPDNITVQVYNTDMSATGGMDYTSGPYSVLIPANVTRLSFNISITNDDDSEGNEYFRLTINSSSLPTGFLVSDPYQATVTIVDDDVLVMFSQATYSVNENAGPAQPVLVISNPPSTDITVQVTSTNGTAGGGEDYESGPYSVTIPANMTRVSFDITIFNDQMVEDDENFALTLDSSSLPTSIRIGDPSQATVTIRDDDSSSSGATVHTGTAAASSVMILLLISIITIVI